jgi:hypothetical protein
MGMVLARNLPRAHTVCLTEMAAGGALAWLTRNVAANTARAAERGAQLWPEGRLTVAQCDWSKYQGGEVGNGTGGLPGGSGGGPNGDLSLVHERHLSAAHPIISGCGDDESGARGGEDEGGVAVAAELGTESAVFTYR